MKLWPQNSKRNKNFIFGRLFYIFLVYRFWYYCVRVSRLKKQQQVNTFLYSKLLTLTHFDNNNCFTVRNRAQDDIIIDTKMIVLAIILYIIIATVSMSTDVHIAYRRAVFEICLSARENRFRIVYIIYTATNDSYCASAIFPILSFLVRNTANAC